MPPDRAPRRPAPPSVTPAQRRANLRLGVGLGLLALAIFLGFIFKSVWLGR